MTLPLYLEQQHYIPAYETDIDSRWRADAIFRCMQEIAGEHSEALHLGREKLLQDNMVFMLARSHIQMQQYPSAFETISIKTWPGISGRLTFPRYFEFRHQDGTLLGTGSNAWILVNLESRRILLPSQVKLEFPDTSALIPPMPEPKKFHQPASMKLTKSLQRQTLYSDIDMNAHMNNASYVSWICDLFPAEQYRQKRIVDLQLNYASEAKPDEHVAIQLFEENDSFYVKGFSQTDNHIVFEAIGRFHHSIQEDQT